MIRNSILRFVQDFGRSSMMRWSLFWEYSRFMFWDCGARLYWQARTCLRRCNLHTVLPVLPATLGAIAVVIFFSISFLTPAYGIHKRYETEAWIAFAAKDYRTALTCFRRVGQLQKQSPENLYGMALTHEALGDHTFAQGLMNELAPSDGVGYAPAHLWVAKNLLASVEHSTTTRSKAEYHLRQALTGNAGNADKVHALLGQLYLADGRLDEAESHLSQALKARPELRLPLAKTYALKGQKERAHAEATKALEYYGAAVKADEKNLAARIACADAATFLEDFNNAKTILEEGLLISHEPAFNAALARVYLVWFDHLSRPPEADLGTRLRLLESGLRCEPNDPALLERLLAVTRVKSAEADRARANLQQLLAKGEMPATVHFILGVDAWERNRMDEARVHWQRANQLDPRSPSLANNLAVVLSRSKSPDLPQALQLVNMAIERAPNEPTFRDTRGTILARMGNWNEALPDLEAALVGAAGNSELHKLLAETYEHLGMAEMTAEHRRLEKAVLEKKAHSSPKNDIPVGIAIPSTPRS